MMRMMNVLSRMLTGSALALSLTAVLAPGLAGAATQEYVCPPCSLPCDAKVHDKPGACPDCGMSLIERAPVAAPQAAVPAKARTLGIVLFPGFDQLDVYGSAEMWSARWADDGSIVTSSGVSAGIDMSLHVIARLYGATIAERLADLAEYEWHRDPSWDPFAKMYHLDAGR